MLSATAGGIRPDYDTKLIRLVTARKQKNEVLFLLSTYGGSADAAYRIGRCLRQYEKVTLLVDANCKSAGTLIALAADEIVMTDTAELGPLDVQLAKPDELDDYSSGLEPIQALSTLRDHAFDFFEQYFLEIIRRSGSRVTTKTAFDLATKLVTGLFQPVFSHLDPIRLGEIQRAMTIALEYGQRIATDNVRDGSLYRLIADYPSHGFVIDRHEAATLFVNVRTPTPEEQLLASLTTRLSAEFEDKNIFLDFLSRYPNNSGETKGQRNEKPQPKKSRGRNRTAASRSEKPAGAARARGQRPVTSNGDAKSIEAAN